MGSYDKRNGYKGEKELPIPFPVAENEADSDCVDGDETLGTDSLLRRFQIEQNDKNNINININININDETTTTTATTTTLDRFPPDVFVSFCSNLTIQDVVSLSGSSKGLYVASRNPDLWQEKFLARWNYYDTTIIDWYFSYQQAYSNPHELWFTHWNCIQPNDCLGSGRCCIEHKYQKKIYDKKKIKESSSATRRNRQKHRCPKCRYHPTLYADAVDDNDKEYSDTGRTPISTIAQAIQAATNLRLEESSHLLPCNGYSPHIAKQAFTKASTLNRSLDHRQYEANSLFFLKDLLFFNVHNNHDENNIDDEPFEMSDWKDYIEKMKKKKKKHIRNNYEHHPLRDCHTLEPALHSWHLVNICNPDHNRGIKWRISIQRSDCFTVFPSEGYLHPGEQKVIVFGVKPFGSVLAHATQQLNVHREGAENFWRDLVCTEEGSLPSTPFWVNYHYASTIPCQRAGSNTHSLFSHQRQQSNDNGLPYTDSSWVQSDVGKQSTFTFVLKGHVHANYALSEFQRKTLIPYSLPKILSPGAEKLMKRYLPKGQQLIYPLSPVVFCSPQLMEFYPLEWQRLQNLHFEEQRNDSIVASNYRTESGCHECGLTWGSRMEELAQAFVLTKLENELEHRREQERFRCIYRLLKCLIQQQRQHNHGPTKSRSWTARNYQVANYLYKKVMNYRSAQWLSRKESLVLFQWEILLDKLCRIDYTEQADLEKHKLTSLRHAGVYRYPLCSDSVFNEKAAFDHDISKQIMIDPNTILWKEEPRHLEKFSHLTHNPGKFFLPHEDSSHLLEIDKRTAERYHEDVTSADIFMNNPLCGLQAAVCVLSDPKSLGIHGLYDKVPYPGSLFRRCKLPILSTLNKERCLDIIRRQYQALLPSFISSSPQLAYYQIQDSLDVESLLIVNSLFAASHYDLQVIQYSISLRNFIKNIPSPGNGRFALSTSKFDMDEHANFLVGTEFWFLDKRHSTSVEELIFEEGIQLKSPSSTAEPPELNQQNSSPQDLHPVNDNVGLRDAAGFNNALIPRGPIVLNFLWNMSSHLGFTVENDHGTESVYVDRRILIGAQWLSISLMVTPLFLTSFARYNQLIPVIPTSYKLEGLPYHTENKMKFLTEIECGYVALLLILLYFALGRWVERYTGRDFSRTMMEHISIPKERRFFCRIYLGILRWGERIWDAVCPVFLQRLFFVPQWNRRSYTDLLRHISYWRSQKCYERRSTFRAAEGRGCICFKESDGSIILADESIVQKMLIGIIVTLGSFSASSPHLFLNILTVFSCSISLGISMSLQSVETDRSCVSANSSGSIIKSLNLVTIVILGFLIGQLVGSSGGVLFLAEFVVTSVSLVLGGMGTISATAMESWGIFFPLSMIAFLGFLFGRCSVLENIRKKRCGFSSIMLCVSLFVIYSLLILSFAYWRWETTMDILIKRPRDKYKVGLQFVNPSFEPRQLS